MAVKRPKKKKLSPRVPAALKRWLRSKSNPGTTAKMRKAKEVQVLKYKDGSVKFKPVR